MWVDSRSETSLQAAPQLIGGSTDSTNDMILAGEEPRNGDTDAEDRRCVPSLQDPSKMVWKIPAGVSEEEPTQKTNGNKFPTSDADAGVKCSTSRITIGLDGKPDPSQ